MSLFGLNGKNFSKNFQSIVNLFIIVLLPICRHFVDQMSDSWIMNPPKKSLLQRFAMV